MSDVAAGIGSLAEAPRASTFRGARIEGSLRPGRPASRACASSSSSTCRVRTALVTGGGRGIGRHIALGLGRGGADVIVAVAQARQLPDDAAALEALGRRAWALPVDLADAASIDALADAALGTVDRLDVLINNAGVIWGAPTLDYPMDGLGQTFAVNVRGLWQLSQRVARHMAERGGGAIVHVSSISGFRGSLEEKEPAIAYNAAKGAVNTLTKDMAVKLARYGSA
jgi:gluconate 5-dehydrogenase